MQLTLSSQAKGRIPKKFQGKTIKKSAEAYR